MNAAPFVIAHRGDSGAYPENTEAAVVAALAHGTPAVECDVQLSRDNVPVVFHDRDLERLCGDSRRVDELDTAELVGRRVRVEGRDGSPSVVITLEHWLRLLPRSCFAVVELKRQRDSERESILLDAALQLLARHSGESALISFSTDIVRWLGERAPRRFGGPIRSKALADGDRDELCRLARGCVVVEKSLADPATIERVHAAGQQLWVYPLDESAEIETAIATGVQGLISNFPARALAIQRGR